MRGPLLKLVCCLPLVGLAGCNLILPEISHRPVIRNPFPQLSRIAVAPFFNHSDESTVNGRQFAMAYFSELQQTPGFEVVPLGVVEEAIIANRIDLSGAGEARRLAQLLGVDAVVVGAVTEYTPYYPPKCGMRVEWYTANPGYHEIPAGYGLPWNTPEEEYIPDALVYESKMALARAQMAAQIPDCDAGCQTLPAPPSPPGSTDQGDLRLPEAGTERESEVDVTSASGRFDPFEAEPLAGGSIRRTQATEALPVGQLQSPLPPEAPLSDDLDGSSEAPTNESIGAGASIGAIDTLPPNWPSANCLVPAAQPAVRPLCEPYHGPVLKHTRVYSGTDPDFTEALESYVYFRHDKRFGGWESYLQRSDDFTRFCCHMHISEMLSARGGSRKTRVVWRWPDNR